MRLLYFVLIFESLILVSCNSIKDKGKSSETNFKPRFIETNPEKDGYVPNSETAIKITKVVWFPLYGKLIDSCEQVKAELSKDGVWKVYNKIPEDAEGVELYAYINRMDGKIIKVYGIRKYKSEL